MNSHDSTSTHRRFEIHFPCQQRVSSDAMSDSSLLNLNCWVHGGEPQNVITVKIPKTDTLKKLIKDESKTPPTVAPMLGYSFRSDTPPPPLLNSLPSAVSTPRTASKFSTDSNSVVTDTCEQGKLLASPLSADRDGRLEVRDSWFYPSSQVLMGIARSSKVTANDTREAGRWQETSWVGCIMVGGYAGSRQRSRE